MVSAMVKVSFIFQMEVIMKEHGKIIRCMAKDAFTIQMEELHMMEDGIWIAFMERAEYIMKLLKKFSKNLIIII